MFVVFFGIQPQAVEKRLGWRMSLPLVLLGALALLGGMLRIPLDSVFPALFKLEHGFSLVSVITLAAPFIGLLIAILFYLGGGFSVQDLIGSGWVNQIRIFLFNGWGMDTLYDMLSTAAF